MSAPPTPASTSGRLRRPLGGLPLPVPAWAAMVVGGALAAPFGPMVGKGGWDSSYGYAVAALVFGAACGAFAGIITGRFQRRLLAFGAWGGAVAAALLVLAIVLHEAFSLAALIVLALLPAALVAHILRLRPAEQVAFCATSLITIGTFTVPVGAALLFANRLIGLPAEPVLNALAAIAGACAWARPAMARFPLHH